MPPTLADHLLDFYLNIRFDIELPSGFRVMNPFQDPRVRATVTTFYRTFLNTPTPRRVLMGINPGRHGGGITGLPFTDTKRLTQACGLSWDGPQSHEPSSEFFYAVAASLGGVEAFYARFVSFPVCPLGFLREKSPGKWVNANYYDTPELLRAVEPFIVQSIDFLVRGPIDRTVVFSLGQGPNVQVLSRLNARCGWFEHIVALPHPRFVIQYRRRDMARYIAEYRRALLTGSALG